MREKEYETYHKVDALESLVVALFQELGFTKRLEEIASWHGIDLQEYPRSAVVSGKDN